VGESKQGDGLKQRRGEQWGGARHNRGKESGKAKTLERILDPGENVLKKGWEWGG